MPWDPPRTAATLEPFPGVYRAAIIGQRTDPCGSPPTRLACILEPVPYGRAAPEQSGAGSGPCATSPAGGGPNPRRGGGIMRSRITRLAPVALAGVAALMLASCAGGNGGGGEGPGDVGEADGTVTIYGTIADTEAELLEQSWADWEEENDIDIVYESSKEFEAQIGSLAQAGNTPDLAIFPQPGLLADL